MPRHRRKKSLNSQPPYQALAESHSFVIRYTDIEVYDSALKHRVSERDTRHAIKYSIASFQLDQASYETKVLLIGPDTAGNLIEVIGLEQSEEQLVVIHAMKIRKVFRELIEEKEQK